MASRLSEDTPHRPFVIALKMSHFTATPLRGKEPWSSLCTGSHEALLKAGTNKLLYLLLRHLCLSPFSISLV